MLITINVDNVGTISNVYWSDSIFFSFEVRCQLGIEITNVQLLFILLLYIPPHVRESGFLNPGNFAFGIRNLGYFACGI